MKMNTEDSRMGVFSFLYHIYSSYISSYILQYGDGLTDDQPPSIISD